MFHSQPRSTFLRSYAPSTALITAALLWSVPHARAQTASPPTSTTTASPYEQRWGSACGDHARVGRLDPPPGRRFTLVVAAESDVEPRIEYAHLDPEVAGRLKAALLPIHAALRTCFAPARYEAWVELALSKQQQTAATVELPQEAVKCASAQLRQAIGRTDVGDAEFVGVRYDHPAGPPPSEQGGGLSKAHIRDVIQARTGEVRACYEQAIRVWPKIFGRVDTRFVIGPDGHVVVVEVTRSSVGRPALECCITSAVKSWRFDAPADGGIVVVRYPFSLRQVPSL